MKHPLLQKRALDAQLEALNDSESAITDPRTDKDYEHPFGSKGTELEIPPRQGADKFAAMSDFSVEGEPGAFAIKYKGKLLGYIGFPIFEIAPWLKTWLEEAHTKKDDEDWKTIVERYVEPEGVLATKQASDPNIINQIWKYFQTHRVGKMAEIVAFTGLPEDQIRPIVEEMGDLGYLRKHRGDEWQMLVGGGKVGATWGLLNDIMGKDSPEEEVQKLVPYRSQEGHNVCPTCGRGLTRMGDPNGKTEWICTHCKYAPKAKGMRAAQMCEQCGERPAIFKSPSTGQYKSDRYHKVCLQCWRNTMESERAKALVPPKAIQRPGSEQFITRRPNASKTAAKNVPDNGQYDIEHESHVREEAKGWAQYAEPSDNTDEIKPFDVTGNYLCGTCDMRRGTDQCSRVEGPINFEKGGCTLYHKGNPETDPDMKGKFSKAEVRYSTSDQGGFGCHRCEYGGAAKAPDPKGRESWCQFWGMHIIPNACCAEQELVKIQPKPKSRIEKLEARHEKGINEILRSSKAASVKCPECGSTEYGLMPSDFETAKCDKCGKTWEIGLVKGVNAAITTMHDPNREVCTETRDIGGKMMKCIKDKGHRPPCHFGKMAREIMHDDSGATTGLRNKPDYGESTSHSSIMNKLNMTGTLKSPLLHRADWTMTCPWCKGTARKDKPEDTFKCTNCSWDATKGEEKAKAQHASLKTASQTYVCENPNCKPVMVNGVPKAGRGVEKEFKYWSPVGEQKTPACIACDQPMKLKSKTAAGDQAVSIHESPRHLPPRNDMREHLDEDTKKEIYDPLKVKREGRPVGHTADDPAWESDLINQEEHFNDQVADMKSEARDAFYSDSDMIAEANHQGMSMAQLWQEMGNDFTNEYWQSRYGSKRAAKLAKCPKCSQMLGKEVTDHKNASVRVFECTACSHLFSL